jgi:hypothetical protein
MANAQIMPGTHQTVQTVIHDDAGHPILIIGTQEFTVVEDGTLKQYALEDSILLQDGLAWNPAMAAGGNPVLLTSCSTCRKPPLSLLRFERATHGLLSVRNARTCADCGIVTCPRHRRLVAGHWRCLRCARWYRFKRLIRPLFFSSHEEL